MPANTVDTRPNLKAVCSRKALSEAVQTVGHAVSGRNALPILNHILIRSEKEGLRLIATDTEIGISCRIPAEIEATGALTAPARLLTEVLANLPDRSDVALSVDRSHTVHIHCDRSDYKILGLPAEEYPNLPDVQDTASFTLPQKVLREMIRQTIFAVSPDNTRPILTGILIAFDGETVRFVSTDTHRLAVKTVVAKEGQGAQNAVVPERAMNQLTRLLSDAEGDVQVTLSSNQAHFALPGADEVQITARLIEGQFPNFQRVIPTQYQKRLTLYTQSLLSAVRRASIVAREDAHRVILRTGEDKLELTASSQSGNAHEEMDVTREGDDVEIAFNARYLLDVLSVLDTERLTLELTEPLKPGVIRPVPPPAQDEEGPVSSLAPDYLCVLMPMQVA
ncbi:MAG: DNA polymerase III subunit beta [Chloroherpetonaceae bacterium]|nr:DNA polymerase III subunit beta [Chthonomonadaceae bacterium]MDW8209312.1 DNA polymerase III subunit beta [Chloroherpetonaceae bacterium]